MLCDPFLVLDRTYLSLLSHHRAVEDGELLARLNSFVFTTTAK